MNQELSQWENEMSEATCRGSYLLGTACGNCEKCDKELREIQAQAKHAEKQKTTGLAQPKFKFGQRVITTLGAIVDFTVERVMLHDGVFHYAYFDKDGDKAWVRENYLSDYTTPPRTYSFTKHQLAEAYDRSCTTGEFFRELGIGDG